MAVNNFNKIFLKHFTHIIVFVIIHSLKLYVRRKIYLWYFYARFEGFYGSQRNLLKLPFCSNKMPSTNARHSEEYKKLF